jgi:hypothetical protein
MDKYSKKLIKKNHKNKTMIQAKPQNFKITIDLSGQEGNAFYIIAVARRLANDLKINFDPIHKEMIGGNYDNLIKTLDKHFGEHILIYR